MRLHPQAIIVILTVITLTSPLCSPVTAHSQPSSSSLPDEDNQEQAIHSITFEPLNENTTWSQDHFVSPATVETLRNLIDKYSTHHKTVNRFSLSWADLQLQSLSESERETMIRVRQDVIELVRQKHFPDQEVFVQKTMLYKRIQGKGSKPQTDVADYDCNTHQFVPSPHSSHINRVFRIVLLLSDAGVELVGGALHLHTNTTTYRTDDACHFMVHKHIDCQRGRLVGFSPYRVHSCAPVHRGSRYGLSMWFTAAQRFSPVYEGGIQPDVNWQKRHLEFLSQKHRLQIPQHLRDRVAAQVENPDANKRPTYLPGMKPLPYDHSVPKAKPKQIKKRRDQTPIATSLP